MTRERIEAAAKAFEANRFQPGEVLITSLTDFAIAQVNEALSEKQAEIASLRRQLKHAETERDAMRQTYDKTVERLERELAALKGPRNIEELPQD